MVQKYVDKALTNPLFHAGINLLSIDDARQGPKAALQGLLAGKEVQQQMAQQKQAQAEAERKKAALAALGQQMPGLQPYIGTGLEGQAMKMFASQMGAGDPSNVREWKYFSSLTPEQKRQYLAMKRSSQFFQVGDVTMRDDPIQGGATVAGLTSPALPTDGSTGDAPIVPPTPLSQAEAQRLLTQQEAEKQAAKEKAKKEGGGIADAATSRIEAGSQALRSLAPATRALTLLSDIETGGIDRAQLAAKRFFGIESADEGELSYLLAKNVLSQLKDTFGAAFTAQEGQRLEAIEAGIGRSAAANKRILSNVISMARPKIEQAINDALARNDYATANHLQSGLDQYESYFSTENPPAPTGGGAPPLPSASDIDAELERRGLK